MPMKPTSAFGQQVLGGADEPESGTQDRHDDRLGGDAPRRGGRQRRLDGAVDGGQRPRGLGEEQRADALEVLAEQRVRCVAVAERGERVGDQRDGRRVSC